LEYGSVRRVQTSIERGAGASESIFEFRLASVPLPPAKRGITVAGQEGLNCTRPMPPGEYRLTAEVELFSGERLSDGVTFEVGAP
jgi:hypothetical protein